MPKTPKEMERIILADGWYEKIGGMMYVNDVSSMFL